MKYQVKLEGHQSSHTGYASVIEIEADSEEEAKLKAQEGFKDGSIVLDEVIEDSYSTAEQLDTVEVVSTIEESE